MRSTRVDDSCPYCKDRKLLRGYNDLATAYPELVAEWDFERNGDLKPTDVIASSNKRVWRKCKEGHEWSGLIANRGARARRTRAARTARGARCSPATTTWPPASRHSGDVAPAHEQALEAHRRAGRKPQARMVARRVRPRLPDVYLVTSDLRKGTAVGILDRIHPMLLGPNPCGTAWGSCNPGRPLS